MTRYFQLSRRNPALGRGQRPPDARFTPRLEALEDRSLPSTFTVLNLHDSGSGSLREAVAAANANPDADVIKFAEGLRGTISLSDTKGELRIQYDLTITGPGADKLTVSGKKATRVFLISGAETDVAISGMTVAKGQVNTVTFPDYNAGYGPVTVGGGVLNDGARLTLSHTAFVGNRADGPDLPGDNSDGAGGAIANVHGGQLTVRYSDFIGNVASGLDYSGGGAILSDGGKSSLVNGGQNYIGTKAVIEHCTFEDNQATRSLNYSGGGALYAGTASAMIVTSCTFEDNLAVGGTNRTDNLAGGGFGGAIMAEPYGWFQDPLSNSKTTLVVADSVFTGNQALGGTGDGGWGSGGGAIFGDIAGTEVTITASQFTGNRAVGRDNDGGDALFAGFSWGGAVGSATPKSPRTTRWAARPAAVVLRARALAAASTTWATFTPTGGPSLTTTHRRATTMSSASSFPGSGSRELRLPRKIESGRGRNGESGAHEPDSFDHPLRQLVAGTHPGTGRRQFDCLNWRRRTRPPRQLQTCPRQWSNRERLAALRVPLPRN